MPAASVAPKRLPIGNTGPIDGKSLENQSTERSLFGQTAPIWPDRVLARASYLALLRINGLLAIRSGIHRLNADRLVELIEIRLFLGLRLAAVT